MVAAFAAAYMSTVATQLNWGASYLINDVYKRFWVKQAGERHYIRASQVATAILMVASCVVTYFQTSVSEAWKLLLAIGAGTGSVQILRWFWWRLNAWSEVSAMGASLVVSLFLQSVLKMNTSDPAGVRHHGADHGGGLDRHLAGGHLPDPTREPTRCCSTSTGACAPTPPSGGRSPARPPTCRPCATAPPTSSTGSPAA